MQPKTLIVRVDVNQKAQQIAQKSYLRAVFEFTDALTISVLGPLDPRERLRKKDLKHGSFFFIVSLNLTFSNFFI